MEPGRELFERYLQAVKKYLPRNRQDDILAELRANLEAQIEEREEELGRPLTEGEMTDWLKQLGSPVQVAGRYQAQQYLIGPAIFPLYWYVLRMAMLWGAVVYCVVNTVLIATGAAGAPGVAEAVVRLPGVLMTVAAWVTLAFAVLEFVSTRYPSVCPQIPGFSAVWSPGSLPPLEREENRGKGSSSFAHVAAEMIFGYIFLVWLLLIPHYPFLLAGPGIRILEASPYRLTPVWMEFYWIVLALNVIQLAWNSFRLWRGTWQQPRTAVNIVSKCMSLLSFAVLLAAPGHAYFALRNPAADQAQYGARLDQINAGIWHSVQIICLIVAIQLVWEVVRKGMEASRQGNTARQH